MVLQIAILGAIILIITILYTAFIKDSYSSSSKRNYKSSGNWFEGLSDFFESVDFSSSNHSGGHDSSSFDD